ncbi:MAG TPA: sigma 54-interacting transcriptional regulator [Pseudomonadota bacterium]|nr:sigma 54-interacting transcriptional regulator [Pseudomonadota bacterium]
MTTEHEPKKTDQTLTATIQAVSSPVPPPKERAYFLVIDGQVSYPVELPESGEVIIGRSPDATIRLDDTSASRHHARVNVTGGDAWIEDMGSRNGTHANGQLIREPRELLSGDVITLCSATLIFHREFLAQTGRKVQSPSDFRARLAEETDRSLGFLRPVSLLCFHFAGGASRRPAILETVHSSLRLCDSVAWTGDNDLLVLLPERDRSSAKQEAERLVSRLKIGNIDVRVGVLSCPRDGSDPDALLLACQSAAQASDLSKEQIVVEDTAITMDLGDAKILLVEPTMKKLYALIERLAKAELPVLIEGETGVGKELAAKALHHHSSRRDKPLLSLNCSAFSENLVESELFGHERGAFSGAVTTKQGLIETANGGTLFLDEIGEMPLSIQAKLLRVLETQRVMRVGDVREHKVNVRFVAATNRNLQTEVTAGRFRRDLYFRLSSARLTLPPLRDRPRELPVLARVLLSAACRKLNRPMLTIADPTMHKLLGHRWPGNVRELRNLMDFLAATVDGETLLPWHVEEQLEHTLLSETQSEGPQPASPKPTIDRPLHFRPIDDEIRELERKRMSEALAASGGVQVRAAELISMPVRTFTTKMKLYKLSSKETIRTGE